MDFSPLKSKTTRILNKEKLPVDQRLILLCGMLRSEVPHYDWVGFYFKNGNKNELKLRAFSGEPTNHKIIPFGKGICGQTAISGKNFMAPDVEKQKNYLACSINVKAEIVVPLFVNGENIGQIDIDSHTANPFSKEDEAFLEFVNGEVAKKIGLRREG